MSGRREIECVRCGNMRRHEGRRLCKSCYRAIKRVDGLENYPPMGRPRKWVETIEVNDDPIDQMRAVRGPGGIVRWIQPAPADAVPVIELAEVVAPIAAIRARSEVTTCPECGCLLKTASETCPGCLAWAERDVVLASWRRKDVA